MKFRASLFVLLAVVCASPIAGQPAAPGGPAVEVVQVAAGVYVVQPPAAMRFDESNAVVVIRDEGVLVVDTQTAPSSARAVIAEIRKLTPKPVRWVVNTHWHGDHVQGNSVYRDTFPGVEFIAHADTREDIEARARPQLKEDIADTEGWIERARKALATGEADGKKLSDEEKKQVAGRIERRTAAVARLREVTEFVLPGKTFTDGLDLPADSGSSPASASGAGPQSGSGSGPQPGSMRGDGDGVIHLRHYLGHTRGDVVIHLPKERVLITGDLLDDLPFTGHGSPQALVETLHALDKLEFDAIVPGHGRVRRGEEAREHLRVTAELFDSIVKQTKAAAAEGLSVDDTKKKVDVTALHDHFVTDDVSGRYWGFFIGEAIARAYDEAAGKAEKAN